ncbi:hypothetical protein ACWCPT_27475 [Streptomyces sp. NPDC002308]
MKRFRSDSQSLWLKAFGAVGVIIGLIHISNDRDTSTPVRIALFAVGCVALASGAWHIFRDFIREDDDRGDSD